MTNNTTAITNIIMVTNVITNTVTNLLRILLCSLLLLAALTVRNEPDTVPTQNSACVGPAQGNHKPPFL